MALLYGLTLDLNHLWLISGHDLLFGLEGYICVHATLLIAKTSLHTVKRVVVRNHWQQAMFEHGKRGHAGRPLDCTEGQCLFLRLSTH